MTQRRDFLGWLGAGSLLATAAFPEDAHAEAPVRPADRVPLAATWDMTWFDRIKGKQVAVFDSPAVSEGSGLFRAVYWRKQVAEVYGTPMTELASVLVLRHEAIPFVMNHDFWDRYEIGKGLKMKDPATKKWARTNPLGQVAEGTPANQAEYTIPSFLASGGTVLACNLAFGQCVSRIGEKEKVARDAARAKALEMLIPGVILQPSGFFAVMKAQETGGGYMVAS